MDLSWMAWTWPTAAFFIFIGLCIASMGVWEYFRERERDSVHDFVRGERRQPFEPAIE